MRIAATIACALVLAVCPPARARDLKTIVLDAKDYALSPTQWDRRDWAWAGGAMLAIGLAYNEDERVRDHFAPRDTTPVGDRHSLRDDIPGAALSLGTYAVGKLSDDPRLVGTGGDMMEAFGLATAGTFAIKHVFARARPDRTNDRDTWRAHGDSFPSGHTAAAFAAAQVLAESRPEGEWTWRTLAYSVGAVTAYARLDGNMHWFSDTVAGAALGIATGHFVSQRDASRVAPSATRFSIQPLDHGARLSFSVDPYALMAR